MEKYDRLHKMVKSLNRSEKRYVKLFIRAFRADSNYLRLLEVVSSMKKYDATRMRQAMRGEKMLRQLSVLKHQLYELILRAMRLYHSRSNEENSLWNDLQSIRFLAGKGLLEEPDSCLTKQRAGPGIRKPWPYSWNYSGGNANWQPCRITRTWMRTPWNLCSRKPCG